MSGRTQELGYNFAIFKIAIAVIYIYCPVEGSIGMQIIWNPLKSLSSSILESRHLENLSGTRFMGDSFG